MSTIVINIIDVQIYNQTSPPTIVTTIDVTNGPNAGIYVAIDSDENSPLIVFEMANHLLITAPDAAFMSNSNTMFPIVDGQTYQVVNQTQTTEYFGIYNVDINTSPAERGLVNNLPLNQTGEAIKSNFYPLEPCASVTFTIDFSVNFPELIIITPGLGPGCEVEEPEPEPNPCACPPLTIAAKPRPSQIPFFLNNGGRRR